MKQLVRTPSRWAFNRALIVVSVPVCASAAQMISSSASREVGVLPRRCFKNAMMGLMLGLSLTATGALTPTALQGQTGISIELFLGSAASASTSLTIRQTDEAEVRFTADYETRPLKTPLYYAFRVALQGPGFAWEVQFIHHKMYLENGPAEIQSFEITHGFNLITLNYSYRVLPVDLRFGAGVVMPHVSATVRDRKFRSDGGFLGTGYRFTGPAFLVGVGKRMGVFGDLFISFDLLGTAGWVSVPVTGGSVKASNVAFHGLLGIGYTL